MLQAYAFYVSGATRNAVLVEAVLAVGAAVLCGWFADRFSYDVRLWAILGFLFNVAGLCGLSSYRAALRRNRNARAWGVAGVLFGPFALFVWMLPSLPPPAPPPARRRPPRSRPPADDDLDE